MKATDILWTAALSAVTTACGDTVTANGPTTLDSIFVTVDAPILAPAIGKATYTQQYHATAYYSDATNTDATGEATWTSRDPSVLTIDQDGLGVLDLIAINVNDLWGDVTIRADFSTVSDSMVLTISPPDPGGSADSLVWDVNQNRRN